MEHSNCNTPSPSGEGRGGALSAIKRSFRLLMNGEASRSMRERGLHYKLNWGIALPDLKRMAASYQPDLHLALALWQEDVRECRIMATLLMPREEMTRDLVDVWMERVDNVELAEQLTHNLLQHLPYAPQLGFEWIARDDQMHQLAGYLLLTKLLARGQQLSERAREELEDQLQTALQGSDPIIKRAAYNCQLRVRSEE